MKKAFTKFILVFFLVISIRNLSFPIITYGTSVFLNMQNTAQSNESTGGKTEDIREEVLDEIITEQKSTLNISAFIREANEYTKKNFADINTSEILSSALTGKVDNQGIINKILDFFCKEILVTIKILAMILAVLVITSIIKTIAENLGNEGASKVAYFVQYILIVTIILSNFSEILSIITTTIDSLIGFLYTLVPLLITLMISTGSIVSANFVQPLILFFIGFIGNLVSVVIIPLVLIGTALSIISNISEKVQIGKISKFFKSTVIWILGIVLTVFVGVLSLEGTLSSSVDGITAKTAKAAVSSLIPVVGKALGDSIDTVLGSAVVLKNAVGIVGVVVLISISVVPIIKLSLITMIYSIATALAEPIADSKIVKLLEQVGDTFKILLGILFLITAIFLIGIAIVIRISNSGMMYR